jgi:hypothetical protein
VADSNLTDLELRKGNDYLVQGNTIQIKAMDINFPKKNRNFSPYRKILFSVLV